MCIRDRSQEGQGRDIDNGPAHIQRSQHRKIRGDGWQKVAEQDEPLRHPHAPGELDKVPVPVLHNAGSDHTGIPGPFDEHIGLSLIHI